MQTIGLCRFSYPAIGGFQVEHDTMEERIAYLYAEARIEERFRLFEHVSLPCLKRQTDPDFKLIVVIGESLPPAYRTRLETLLADLPQARLEVHPPRPNRELMKELLNAHRDDPDAPCLQFRHDDDDAVAVEFIQRLKHIVAACAPLMGTSRVAAIDFNRGFVAEIGPEGIAASETTRPYYVASLGVYITGGSKLTIHNYAHHKIYQHMTTLTFTDQPMWVRTHNGYNDSRQKKNVRDVPVAPLTRKQRDVFEDRFAIDADRLRQVFSG